MKCPNCNIDLVMADRQDLEIYFCEQCRGIWLDRGELCKIFEQFSNIRRREPDADRESRDQQTSDTDYVPKKGRKSLLGKRFDFYVAKG